MSQKIGRYRRRNPTFISLGRYPKKWTYQGCFKLSKNFFQAIFLMTFKYKGKHDTGYNFGARTMRFCRKISKSRSLTSNILKKVLNGGRSKVWYFLWRGTNKANFSLQRLHEGSFIKWLEWILPFYSPFGAASRQISAGASV